jgi:8-oxo-dGTP pyrophosphatase MutT (NUDIX family)
VLPKGKIETYESHQEAALREVREEAKVTARIVGLVGESTFEVEGNLVRSKFYLMEFVRTDLDNKKDRVTNWKDFNEARRLLTHPESKAILDLAAELG